MEDEYISADPHFISQKLLKISKRNEYLGTILTQILKDNANDRKTFSELAKEASTLNNEISQNEENTQENTTNEENK